MLIILQIIIQNKIIFFYKKYKNKYKLYTKKIFIKKIKLRFNELKF
jgi:hypothetical protein